MRSREVKIANAVRHPVIKQNYDPKISPARNLEKLGFEANANNLLCSKGESIPNAKYKAFVGFSELESSNQINTKKKVQLLDEIQMKYAKDCINKFGDDYESMSKDIKVNYNQMTAAKLKKICSAYLKQTNNHEEE